jgi:hypothetical protein
METCWNFEVYYYTKTEVKHFRTILAFDNFFPIFVV